MLQTYIVKHNLDLGPLLLKAREVANFAIANRDLIPKMSSKHVKQFDLPSAIANQVLKKYKNNKKCNKATNVNLIIPGQTVEIDKHDSNKVNIDVRKDFRFQVDLNSCGNLKPFTKVNQVEADETYFYVTVTVVEQREYVPKGALGVDLNIASAMAVVANSKNDKVMFLGRSQKHIRNKQYKRRKKLQELKKLKAIKKMKKKEHRILRDMLHKVSRNIVKEAKKNKQAIVLEDLKNIRETSKLNRKGRHARRALHSWSFAQLKSFIEYKARLLGVPVLLVNPRYSSQNCSRCHKRGVRKKDVFECTTCQRTEHADINAAQGLAWLGLVELGLTAA